MGCVRDRAGNRELHYDEFCLLLLLGLFNPVVDSLRAPQQASQLESVQKRLKLRWVSLGAFSEASRVFNAELLQPILEEIGEQLTPLGRDRRLADVPHTLTLVDGTLEVFFRFFKQLLGCRKLYFRSQNGIELQAYCAIIAGMLLCLWTARKPTKRT